MYTVGLKKPNLIGCDTVDELQDLLPRARALALAVRESDAESDAESGGAIEGVGDPQHASPAAT